MHAESINISPVSDLKELASRINIINMHLSVVAISEQSNLILSSEFNSCVFNKILQSATDMTVALFKPFSKLYSTL